MKIFDLFNTSGFTPHAACIGIHEIIMAHVLGDILTASSAFAISLLLFYFAAKRDDFTFNTVLKWFALFIMLCGFTHVMAIVVLFKPMYVLDGWVKVLTGIAAWVTLFKLVPNIIPIINLNDDQVKNLELLREVGSLNEFARSVRERDIQKSMRLHEIATSISEYADAIGGVKRSPPNRSE